MKMKLLVLVFALVFVASPPALVAGGSPKADEAIKGAKMTKPNERKISKEKQGLLDKYCFSRWLIIAFNRGLSMDDCIEDLRRWYAKSKGLSEDITWEKLLTHKDIVKKLKPELRIKYSNILFDCPNRTWLEILMELESMRLEQRYP